jgi:hypothetical protein
MHLFTTSVYAPYCEYKRIFYLNIDITFINLFFWFFFGGGGEGRVNYVSSGFCDSQVSKIYMSTRRIKSKNHMFLLLRVYYFHARSVDFCFGFNSVIKNYYKVNRL